MLNRSIIKKANAPLKADKRKVKDLATAVGSICFFYFLSLYFKGVIFVTLLNERIKLGVSG